MNTRQKLIGIAVLSTVALVGCSEDPYITNVKNRDTETLVGTYGESLKVSDWCKEVEWVSSENVRHQHEVTMKCTLGYPLRELKVKGLPTKDQSALNQWDHETPAKVTANIGWRFAKDSTPTDEPVGAWGALVDWNKDGKQIKSYIVNPSVVFWSVVDKISEMDFPAEYYGNTLKKEYYTYNKFVRYENKCAKENVEPNMSDVTFYF